MSAVTSREVKLEAGVAEFLKRHGAEAAFQTACALVRECFPDSSTINVSLLEDPDEENHTWVVLEVSIPTASSTELTRAQEDRFFEEMRRRVPLPYHPLSFSLHTDPSGE